MNLIKMVAYPITVNICISNHQNIPISDTLNLNKTLITRFHLAI